MQHLRSKAVVLGLAAAAMGALSFWRQAVHCTSAGDPGELDGRTWIEKRPVKHTDYVHVAFFLSRANFGVFERASSYDVHLELADITRKEDKLTVYFPQSGKSATVSVKVQSCSDLPPFDLCLDLSDNPWGGPRRYYGFSKPEEESSQLGELAERARRLAAERAAGAR
jgi:hypothetical protein